MNSVFQQAIECWQRGERFRKERARCKDYAFGRQWNDIVPVDGSMMTEYEYILRQGCIPMKNNLIHRIVRNITGVLRRRLPALMETESDLIASLDRQNNLSELYARSFEEFLISGLVVHKKWIGRRNGKTGVWTDPVPQDLFFFDHRSCDFRGVDLDMIGQIHDVDFNEWCHECVATAGDYEKARSIFSSRDRIKIMEIWKRENVGRFLVHNPSGGCLISVAPEVFSQNSRLTGLRKKWTLTEIWRYYFITEDGVIIAQGDSPYMHGSHPYVMRGYPFLDGEIHSLVADIIDQQRYTNRLITLYDWAIRSSAKGVLLLPSSAVAPEDINDVVREWSKVNGVISYNHKVGMPEPKQINADCTNLAISQLLEIQLRMFEDISGVNGALQGNLSSGSVSGKLYETQTDNAMISLEDILGSFISFMQDCRRMDEILLKQNMNQE